MNHNLTSIDSRYNSDASPYPPAESNAPARWCPPAVWPRAQFVRWVFDGALPIIVLSAAAVAIFCIGAILQTWRMVVTG